MSGVQRCDWCGDDPQYVAYHDTEWGVPVYEERTLFEMLTLEGAQAGLSWLTILRKRNNYRRAFAGFDVDRVAQFGETEYQRLMADAGIVRNQLKIRATINNAQCILRMRSGEQRFEDLVWSFVKGQPQHNDWQETGQLPASTATSEAMSKALKARGFRFVGSTICYAFMQATGMVNDHIRACFRHPSHTQR